MDPIHLTVLGATGRVGSLVVREALDGGHAVSALVRDPARLPADLVDRKGLTVVTGELDDPGMMARALTGSDAIVVALGVSYKAKHPWSGIVGRTDVVPTAVRALLAAGNVSPVVLLSAFGVGDSWEGMSAAGRMVIRTSSLRTAYAELSRAEEMLEKSLVPHAVVRAVTLIDGLATGGDIDATGRRLRGNPQVVRADVAQLLVRTATELATGSSGTTAQGRRVLVAAAAKG